MLKEQAELKERREQRRGRKKELRRKRKSDDDYPWCRPAREWRAVSEVVVYLGGPRRERMRGSSNSASNRIHDLRALQSRGLPGQTS